MSVIYEIPASHFSPAIKFHVIGWYMNVNALVIGHYEAPVLWITIGPDHCGGAKYYIFVECWIALLMMVVLIREISMK